MALFRRTVVVQDETPTADGTYDYDLPINPLSHLIFTHKCLNAGVNTKATLAQMLGAIEKVEITQFGATVISLNGADLYALNCYLLGKQPWQGNIINTDNAVRFMTLMIPFGRKLYDPGECMPATARGELTLKIQTDIADTGYDGVIFQVEAVELLEATPTRRLKYTTISHTPSATGESDIDLPIGNPYVGLLVYSTTVPDGTSWTTTVDWVKLLIDNTEKYYSKANWESLHGDFINRLDPAVAWSEKIHMENLAATYTQNVDTAAEEVVDTDLENYAVLDFDPRGNDMFLCETAGASSVTLRINAGDTNACRVIPIELVSIT